MLDFLKRFGLGIAYVLLSPFILAFLALWAIYASAILFVELVRGFKNFFRGKHFFAQFPEDIEAKRILNLEQFNNPQPVNPNPQVNNPQPINPNNNMGDNNSL